jgi:predicted phage-related endonuclease
MNLTKIEWSGDSHEQWIAQRKETEGIGNIDVTRIGASDISVITGSNKWKCKRRLFYHLIGMYSLEWRSNKSVAGHLLEPLVATNWESWVPDKDEHLFNLERRVKLRKTKEAKFFLLNDKYPQLFASIDRLHDGETFSPFTGEKYNELTPIELKTTEDSYYRLWTDGITQGYNEQVMSQMMVSNTKVAVFCVLVNGVYFHAREVEYDSFLADKIDHETREFATLCKAGKQLVDLIKSSKSEKEIEEYTAMLDEIGPDPLELQDEQDLNRELFSNSNGTIKGDESDFKYILDYTAAMDQIKASEEAKQLAKNNLITKMKDAEELVFEGGKVVWRRSSEKKDYFSIRLNKV